MRIRAFLSLLVFSTAACVSDGPGDGEGPPDFSLDPMSTDPGANDSMDVFCYGSASYTGGLDFLADHGTPGEPNPACE